MPVVCAATALPAHPVPLTRAITYPLAFRAIEVDVEVPQSMPAPFVNAVCKSQCAAFIVGRRHISSTCKFDEPYHVAHYPQA